MFDPESIISKSISPYEKYCTGYLGKGGYLVAVVAGIGIQRKCFSHSGSDILDFTVAYDRAEADDAYVGQINIVKASSFCGMEGLIWGYDVARCPRNTAPLFESTQDFLKDGITLLEGKPFRDAARLLFGTRERRHFPLLPGAHVFCAAKCRFFHGPARLYSSVAIGIPEDRERFACLIMEDVGRMTMDSVAPLQTTIQMRKKNLARSVVEVGENHGVSYKEIIIDFVSREVARGAVGCAMVAVPYIQLASLAYLDNLTETSIVEWVERKKSLFLDSYSDST